MGSMIYALSDLVGVLLSLLTYAIIIRAVLSWFQPDANHPLIKLLLKVTDPVLEPIRRMLPDMGGLDLSPIVAIFAVQMARTFFNMALFTLFG